MKGLYLCPRYVKPDNYYKAIKVVQKRLHSRGINIDVIVLNKNKKRISKSNGFTTLKRDRKKSLKKIENKYSFSTRKIMHAERIQVGRTFDRLLKEKKKTLPELEKIVRKKKYDFILRSQSTNTEFYFISKISPFFKFENIVHIHDFFGRTVFCKEKENAGLKLIKRNISSGEKSDHLLRKIKRGSESRKNERSDRKYEKNYELYNRLKKYIYGTLATIGSDTYKSKHEFCRRVDEKYRKKKEYESIPNHEYAFLPYHKIGESTLEWRAGPFSNQIFLTEIIARNLPIGNKLVVKEHPNWEELYSYEFVKEIASIENVVVVSPNTDVKKIIKGASFVTVMNNTTGYEAIALGTPVVSFSHSPYLEFDKSVKVRNLYNTDKCLMKAANINTNMSEGKRFIQNMCKWSSDIQFQAYSMKSKTDAEKKAALFAESFLKAIA